MLASSNFHVTVSANNFPVPISYHAQASLGDSFLVAGGVRCQSDPDCRTFYHSIY